MEILQELARNQFLQMHQTIAVGDGANDLLMIHAAGLGVAFRAKSQVRQKSRHCINKFGLDSLLYILGYHENDLLS